MTLHWIDPLKIVYRRLHAGGDWRPPEYLRQNFGSLEHYTLLAEELAKFSQAPGTKLIDFLPFSRLPNLKHFVTLQRLGGASHFTFLCSNDSVKEDIRALDERLASHIVTATPTPNGPTSEDVTPSLLDAARLAGAVPANSPGSVLFALLRRAARESWIQQAVLEHTIQGSTATWAEGECRVGGRHYLRMANRMLVTHFINMKAMLSDVQKIDALAYEVAWQSCCGFVPDAHAYWPDLLVAANDLAFLIGAAAQRLCGVPCAVIDRIGILPGRHLTRDTVSQDVTDKRVVLISELSATASEIERAVSLLVQRGARISLIICCVWLECAFPRFVDRLPFIGLCRPKKRLSFVYRSAV
jgi:hypothetical protein